VKQEVYTCAERLPLEAFPVPAYGLVDLGSYMMGTVQFSSGCPYLCEFLRHPGALREDRRVKGAEKVLADLDALLAVGNPGSSSSWTTTSSETGGPPARC